MNVATDIEKQVIELAAEHAGVEPGEVSAATHFVNDLHFDSLDLVEITMEFEDCFNITIPDEEAETTATIAQAVELIARKLRVA